MSDRGVGFGSDPVCYPTYPRNCVGPRKPEKNVFSRLRGEKKEEHNGLLCAIRLLFFSPGCVHLSYRRLSPIERFSPKYHINGSHQPRQGWRWELVYLEALGRIADWKTKKKNQKQQFTRLYFGIWNIRQISKWYHVAMVVCDLVLLPWSSSINFINYWSRNPPSGWSQ